MRNCFVFVFLCGLTTGKHITKRQLFREQVLPDMGGKVPDSAFQTDRLALNQLNARGIYSTSGVYLEHHSDKERKTIFEVETMQVRVPHEDRYVAPAGRLHYRTPPTLDTTYSIRDPVRLPITPNLRYQPQPHLPYNSLKLQGYFKGVRQEYRGQAGNEIEDADDFEIAKKEYEPYLKKLHELDK